MKLLYIFLIFHAFYCLAKCSPYEDPESEAKEEELVSDVINDGLYSQLASKALAKKALALKALADLYLQKAGDMAERAESDRNVLSFIEDLEEMQNGLKEMAGEEEDPNVVEGSEEAQREYLQLRKMASVLAKQKEIEQNESPDAAESSLYSQIDKKVKEIQRNLQQTDPPSSVRKPKRHNVSSRAKRTKKVSPRHFSRHLISMEQNQKDDQVSGGKDEMESSASSKQMEPHSHKNHYPRGEEKEVKAMEDAHQQEYGFMEPDEYYDNKEPLFEPLSLALA